MQEKNYNLLWAALRNDDEEALTEIRERYYDELFLHALNLLPDSQDPKDVLQDVFIKLWGRRKALPPEVHVETYLHRMVYNACMDYFRSQKKKRTSLPQQDVLQEQGIQNDPLVIEENRRLIYTAIEELPAAQRTVFFLSNQDLSYQEIADQTGRSIHTVRNLLARARKTLREKLIILRRT